VNDTHAPRAPVPGRAARPCRAFTLVELLIVVTILGILAALVMPKFSDASAQARDASIATQLKTIRTQIDLHDYQNPGAPFNPLVPGGAAAWDQLVNNDYLHSAPENPFQFDSPAVGAVPGVGVGWVWADPLGTGTTIYAVDDLGAFYDGDGDGAPD
jgi:prepilin-type N-terminal cleavage/methylation domain-containing protein